VSARERYVDELERRLPFALGHRARAVNEVREHLREGGEEALARFGPVDELAAELRPELRARAVVTVSWLVPLLTAAFVVPFYLVPENAFPPAPWDSMPGYLAWKHDAALMAFVAALAAAAAAAVAARISWSWAIVPLCLAVAALAVAATLASVLDVQWIEAVPGTPATVVYALVPARVAFVAAATALLVAALRDGGRELAAD
jgi:hypothetical protein